MAADKKHLELFARLADFIPEKEIRFREGSNGGHYIKAPTAFNRLDSVLGPAGWWDDYRIIDDLTVECSLTIRLPDGSTLTKRDVGIRKPMAAGKLDPGNSWKAAYSDSFKRAAAKFGVARHLSKCGFASFVGEILEPPPGDAAEPEPPPLPLPAPSAPPGPNLKVPPQPVENGHHKKERHDWTNAPSTARPVAEDSKVPKSGKALFAWVREQEQKHEVGLLKYLNSWAKLQDFPGRMIDWDADLVKQGYAEAVRKLQSIEGVRS
jgi:hypothetical protein